jgi:hypothetical protein
MENKIKFADLFEVNGLKNIRINKKQLKSISGGTGESLQEITPIIDIELTPDSYTLNQEE